MQQSGVLYVVATPIGNRADLSPRAVEVLRAADIIAAEDTRHSRPLLAHFGIHGPLVALHEHNEQRVAAGLLARLLAGESVALISDAGTPLLSDPGYQLVRSAREQGIRVSPVPGPSALLAALSVAGLPTDRFVFEGFLPSKPAARRARLTGLKDEPRTLVFYESAHRIVDCVRDMAAVLGAGREAVLARELTKLYEQVHSAALGDLAAWLEVEPNRQKGEFVVLVRGAEALASDRLTAADERLLGLLLAELPAARAAALAARITGKPKRLFYARAVGNGE